VLLDGLNGDGTVFYGYSYLGELARQGLWGELQSQITALAGHDGTSVAKAWNFYGRRYIAKALIPQRVWKGICTVRGQTQRIMTEKIRKRNALRQDFLRDLDYGKRLEALDSESLPRNQSCRWDHYLDLTSGFPTYNFESVEKLSARYGVECRFPFADRRLTEFCLALPGDQKLRNGWDRWILRRGMQGILPEKVRWRKDKGDLEPNFHRGFLAHESGRMNDLFSEGFDHIAPFFNREELRALHNKYLQRRKGDSVDPLWMAIHLSLWLADQSFSRGQDKSSDEEEVSYR
jgi:asparagine synthase (glutamine-hydrolysing)